MPVKDAIESVVSSIKAIIDSGYMLTVYNDFSTTENTVMLQQLSEQLHFTLINLQDHTSHPSPNYRLTLQLAQAEA